MASLTSTADVPRYARDRNLQLARVVRLFFRETPPKLLLASTVGLLAARLAMGSFTWLDLAFTAGMFAAQPFIEWLIHVFVLHHKPRRLFGLDLDFHAAKAHRQHHEDPWNLPFVVMPLPALLVGSVVQAATWYAMTPTLPLFFTTMLVSGLMSLHYEWVHFLVHTSYVPKTALYRRMWRLHRLHHFKNEHYWMGVTRHLGDVVLGTMKEQDEVPTSATARRLL